MPETGIGDHFCPQVTNETNPKEPQLKLKLVSWNCTNGDPDAHGMKLLQLQEIVDDRGVDIFAPQEILAPSLHLQGFTTAPYPFTKGKNWGTTLLIKNPLI
jgi:endonuclease/exonuclease/phosphatase family metal-dependent hydrolase